MRNSKPITRKETENWLDQLPPAMLHRIRLCAHERQVPIDLPLMVSLAAIAASVGAGVEVFSGRDRTTRANLLILLGVSSGIGKSEIFRDLIGPLTQFESNLHTWWEDEPATKARAGEELLKAQVSSVRSSIRKFPRGGLELFQALQLAERKRGICRNYLEPPCLLADDSTSEALAQIMYRSHESIATVSADARFFLKRLSTPNGKEESFFLKAFSGDLALTNRVSRNSIRLRNPCLTALLLTQRDAYENFTKKAVVNRSGLLPRFLHAEIAHDETDSGKIDRRRVSTIRRDYTGLITELIEAFRFEAESTQIASSSDATQYLRKIEQDCRVSAASDESLTGEVLRRRAEQSWRVALCIHLARYGERSAAYPISLEDAKTAAHIVKRFTQLNPYTHRGHE